MNKNGSKLSRRDVLRLSASGSLVASASCAKAPSAAIGAPAAPSVVRVASVPTAVDGNLLPTLFAEFEKQSPMRVQLVASDDVYGLARKGLVDLVISHYGHRDAEAFVMDGHGEWPRTLFSNQMALLGPAADPAKIRDLADAGEAFRRIAETKSPYVVNHIDGVRYLTEVLWNAAGCPDRAGWMLDGEQKKDNAIRLAAERGAYVLWGLTPFLRLQHETPLGLEPLVLGDPLLQRMLVSIVVKGANVAGASAVQTFLLAPATQARIRAVRYPGANAVAWVPGARHNRTAILPLT